MTIFDRILLRMFLANLVRAEAVLVVAGVTLGAGAWATEGGNLAILAGGLALQALPPALLAATPNRATRFGGFLTALAVFVAYAVVTATADAFSRHGVLSPTAAAWLPPSLFTVSAALLWRPFLSRRCGTVPAGGCRSASLALSSGTPLPAPSRTDG